MYLKSIEVQGFKSFAQKILFEFHPGITGIVGPNGSGKSNVADAVRWVLGEQSAKQLRGGNMQDVIFSGTQARKPLSFAQVAITLDNADHKLPVDYEEVTVARRLYRSGESEYLLNGVSCRLRDINELFYDTGIGKEGYSIIGQGQIDRILSSKPEERRELFDEAAGIVKFKRRKAATLKKLSDEEANLVRISDMLSELERQVRPWERQAEAAKKYLAYRDRQRLLDVNIFLHESEKLRLDLESLRTKLSDASAQLAEANGQYEETKRAYEEIQARLEELDTQLSDVRARTQECSQRRQQLEGQIGVCREQIAAGVKNSALYKEKLISLAQEIQEHKDQIRTLTQQKSTLIKEAESLAAKLSGKEEELAHLNEEITACEEEISRGKAELIEIINARSTTKGNAERFTVLAEQISIRKAEVSQRLLHIKTEEQSLCQQTEEVEKELAGLGEKLDRLSKEKSATDSEEQELSGRIHRQNDEMQLLQASFHRENSRLDSMKNIAERYDGYGQSIRRVMEQKEKVTGLRGVVADLIQTDRKFEQAIETALGGSIQNIVTDTEQTAKEMIGFLKKNRYGRATFLPLDAVNGRGAFSPAEALAETGVIGVADTLISTAEEFRGLASYLLGSVLVVDTIDHAIALAGKYRHRLRLVTLDGESLSPGGSMTGGAFKNSSNLLGRRREIEELEKKVEKLRSDGEHLAGQIGKLREKRNEKRVASAELSRKIQSLLVDQNTAQIRHESLKEKAGELAAELSSVKAAQEEIRADQAGLDKEKSRIDQELVTSSQDEEECSTFVREQEEELSRLRQDQAELMEELGSLRLSEQTVHQQEGFVRENLTRITQELEAGEKEHQETEKNLEQGMASGKEKQSEIEQLMQEIAKLGAEEQAGEAEIREKEAERTRLNGEHKTFFTRRDELSGQINLLDKECLRLKSQADRLEENRDAQIAYLWDEYQLSPHHAADQRFSEGEEMSLREMKKELSGIREKIKNLGPVNVQAIEEYRDLSERHAFLSGQVADLKKAKETLEKIITELDDGMRRQFTEKFREIEAQFDKTFKELFGGGKGSLALEEDVDILEAGIYIISQPPGKKLQNMMQLSGGEKALTAIALLFAIQSLKPSPFCLLDEIEAALDDSNVGRFAGYLQKLTKDTQFIIITHRRGTMNAADRLYGITMQEKGVSALVSVDLVENQLSA